MRAAFIARLEKLAEKDPLVMLVTADVGFGVLDQFARRFPKQFVNVGVAEQLMTSLATGMALEGRTVFTYSIANFPTLRCLEQIRNDAAHHKANVKIVAVGGGLGYAALGFSHHATEDLAILRAVPGVRVVAPGDTSEASDATAAIASEPGVHYLRLDRSAGELKAIDNGGFQLGRARCLRDGRDLSLVACGGVVAEALRAAEKLAEQGVSARVLSMHTVKPLDIDAIRRAVEETQALFTVEEHSLIGGLGSAVGEVILDHDLRPKTFLRIGLRAGYESYIGSQEYGRRRFGLDADGIAASVLRALELGR